MATPDPVLQFFLSVFYKKAIDPTSKLYLPKLIVGQTNPLAEPYVIDGTWNNLDLGDQGANGASMICASTGPLDEVPIPAGNPSTPMICLVDPAHVGFPQKIPFQIVGLSNIMPAEPLVTDGDNISASATFGQIATWHIPSLVLQGNFTVDQSCCITEDGVHCDPGTQYATHGEGTFVATFKSATATVQGAATVSPDGSSLTVQINSLAFAAKPTDLDISIVIYTITDPTWRDTYSKNAENVLNFSTTKASIVAQISAVLNSPSTRQSFAQVINNALASLVP